MAKRRKKRRNKRRSIFSSKRGRIKRNLINYTITGKRRIRARDAYKAYNVKGF